MKSINRSGLFRWLLSLILIVYLISLIDHEKVLKLFPKAHPIYIFLAILLILGDRILMGFKWGILLKAQGVTISFLECIRAYFVGSFAGVFLPVSVGSDLVRWRSLAVDGDDRDRITASILVEKFLAMVASFFLVSLCLLFVIQVLHLHLWKYFLIDEVLLAITFSIFVYSLLFLSSERLEKSRWGFLRKFAKIILAYRQFRFYRKTLVLFFFLSFFENFFPVLVNFFVAKAFDLPGSFFSFLMIIPVTVMIARIPVSMDGLGVQEALYLLLFPLAGLSQPDAVFLGFAARVVLTFCLLTGGAYCLWRKN